MKIIVYGKDREIFESNKVSVPDSIADLYQYCGGRMGKELFTKIIDGLVNTGTIKDMVDVFEHMSCETPIWKIYTGANSCFESEVFEDDGN